MTGMDEPTFRYEPEVVGGDSVDSSIAAPCGRVFTLRFDSARPRESHQRFITRIEEDYPLEAGI